MAPTAMNASREELNTASLLEPRAEARQVARHGTDMHVGQRNTLGASEMATKGL